MAKKDINKAEFSEETMLKLDIFRQCFREWYPVFVHNPYISHIFVYDMFAGSGKDIKMNPGSPIILFQEARGDKKQHCKSLLKRRTTGITFGFNELESEKRQELESNVSSELSSCQAQCTETKCPFENAFHYGSQDFSSLIKNTRLNQILSNPKFAKFILLDQYGFKQINDDVFLRLINSPTTDFIFFVASSFVKRFKDLPAVTAYFNKNKITFNETQPKECHKVITDYSSASYDAHYRGAYIIYWWAEKDYLIDKYQMDKKYENRYKKINEFHDGKNYKRLIEELQQLNII